MTYERPTIESRLPVRGLLGDDFISCLESGGSLEECFGGGLGSEFNP